MTIRSAVLVAAFLSAAAASTAYGQQTQPGPVLMTHQVPAPRIEGRATDRTDKSGQTYAPDKSKPVTTPRSVPNWKIPLPRIHGGR